MNSPAARVIPGMPGSLMLARAHCFFVESA